MRTLTAAQFWTEFLMAFESASQNPATEVGIHYRKYGVRPGSGEVDTEWTHIMGVFLSRLAIALGFYQEWEDSNIDFAWHDEDRMKPSVAVEHENDYRKIIDEEVPNLLSCPAPLKVLITYLDPPKPVAKANLRVKNMLGAVTERFRSGKTSPAGEFAVVIGGGLEDPRDWTAYLWSGKGQNWIPLT